jgi:hypothetical protein
VFKSLFIPRQAGPSIPRQLGPTTSSPQWAPLYDPIVCRSDGQPDCAAPGGHPGSQDGISPLAFHPGISPCAFRHKQGAFGARGLSLAPVNLEPPLTQKGYPGAGPFVGCEGPAYPGGGKRKGYEVSSPASLKIMHVSMNTKPPRRPQLPGNGRLSGLANILVKNPTRGLARPRVCQVPPD